MQYREIVDFAQLNGMPVEQAASNLGLMSVVNEHKASLKAKAPDETARRRAALGFALQQAKTDNEARAIRAELDALEKGPPPAREQTPAEKLAALEAQRTTLHAELVTVEDAIWDLRDARDAKKD